MPAPVRKPAPADVVAANREFYRTLAAKYDRYESVVAETYYNEIIERDIGRIADDFAARAIAPVCLDCGGGTGNLTLRLLRRGWRVTVVDISPDMLAISRQKIIAAGLQADFVQASIEEFLPQTSQLYDLISFSSVLHHLYSPAEVLAAAATRISCRGFLYSNFDPLRPASPRLNAWLRDLDTLIGKLLRDRSDLLPGLVRRLRKRIAPPNEPAQNTGDLAEFHARRGLDHVQLSQVLQANGFAVDCLSYPAGRTSLLRLLSKNVGALMNVRLLAQRSE